ncbi:PCYCGC motif-containing (lipo)protein [Geobacillus stearothermophilus]|nr:PCYCGC motif-containing (lipo)protein [Geobacillus stearothermophilus]MED3842412.1 PCYCGC motif-containing (lipo)protein [Geobacillus stearothermophilus]MED4332760.1 PCYCGC motif-containing (lipo)protein [Geobacillus stearothermophilus]MED4356855.1 PCYCGC motif-containing (lipo)protein [Geobacillus stearothermophilus]MED4831052.1 PCYCGC motif-containing (lipo)protein [Geobacillus stearothermophilus]MED4980324.1 PCYCGC motif-containing (lipo)protein [Geobacillus stearothermophilus]
MRRPVWMAACMLSFSVLLSGCADGNSQEQSHSHITKTATGDIRETTKSIEHLPSFLSAFEEEMAVLYQQAAEHRELLENIPCYCGCGQSAGHKNSYDCFVYETKQDGSVVWDDHATKCGVCLEIAAESIAAYDQGKSIKDIRHMIDEKYKEGYAEPTPTKPL